MKNKNNLNNDVQSQSKQNKTSGLLPFIPVLTTLHSKLADIIRNKKNIIPTNVLEQMQDNQLKRLPGSMFVLEGEFLTSEMIEPEKQLQAKQSKSGILEKCIKSLEDNTSVLDDVKICDGQQLQGCNYAWLFCDNEQVFQVE